MGCAGLAAQLDVRHTKLKLRVLNMGKKTIILWSMFFIAFLSSCGGDPVRGYESKIISEKGSGSKLQIKGEAYLTRVTTNGDSILNVRGINVCRYTQDSLFVCDSPIGRDSIFLTIDQRQYYAVKGRWCGRMGCTEFFDLYLCKKFEKGYTCN